MNLVYIITNTVIVIVRLEEAWNVNMEYKEQFVPHEWTMRLG